MSFERRLKIMAKNLIDESKKWITHFYNGGIWSDNVSLRNNGRVVEEEVVEFMRDYFHFLIESNFLNDCTLMWLNSNMGSVREAVEVYNNQCDEMDRLNLNTAQSKIEYDKKKLKKYFDNDMLFNVLSYPDKWLEDYRNILDRLVREYYNDKEYKKAMIIDLPKECINKKLDDYSFVKMTEVIERYSKRYVESIKRLENKEMTKEMIGYYNYLISNKRLSKIDSERLKIIRELLGLNTPK